MHLKPSDDGILEIKKGGGMDERALHDIFVRLRGLKAWHLGLALVVLLLMSVFFLRQNNLHMITLRNMVMQADEQNKDIPLALTNLRNYVASHMNTGMGEQGIYLEHSYRRSYDGAIQQAANNGTASAVIYQNAESTCKAQYNEDSAFVEYGQCLAAKVQASGAPAISTPSGDLYRFNFVSPVWSPDVAGFTVLAMVLAGILLVGRALLQGVVFMLYRANR